MSNILNANAIIGLDWIEDIGLLSAPYQHSEMNQVLLNLVAASADNPVVNGATFSVTMPGGTGSGTVTLDLTNLTGNPAGNRVDGSNGGGTSQANQVEFFVVWNKGSNPLTISNAGSDSYPLWGNTYSKTLQPGQYDFFIGNSQAAQVLPTQKNILLSGMGGDVYWFAVLFGGSYI